MLILPFGIFLFSENVEKATDSKPVADQDLQIQVGVEGGGGGRGGRAVIQSLR